MIQFSKFLLLCVALAPLSMMAQPSGTKESSDPKAKAILDKVKQLYAGYESLESGFTLTIKLAEQPKEEVQKGKIMQQGNKFRVEMGKQTIISDGKSVWHKMDNTVRIMNASSKDAGELMSPNDLMKIYEKKDYVYAILGEGTDGWSKRATIIGFKPTKRNSEYTQIKVAIDQKTNQVVSITAFGRDQSRYKLGLDQPATNKKYQSSLFVFDKSKFPNVKVEDLRED